MHFSLALFSFIWIVCLRVAVFPYIFIICPVEHTHDEKKTFSKWDFTFNFIKLNWMELSWTTPVFEMYKNWFPCISNCFVQRKRTFFVYFVLWSECVRCEIRSDYFFCYCWIQRKFSICKCFLSSWNWTSTWKKYRQPLCDWIWTIVLVVCKWVKQQQKQEWRSFIVTSFVWWTHFFLWTTI